MQKEPKNIPLFEIGSTVRIDLSKISDTLPLILIEEIERNPIGKVIDYKMTDGTGVGIIVKLESGRRLWFFNEEVSIISLINFKSDSESIIANKQIEINTTNRRSSGNYMIDLIKVDSNTLNKKISKLINPLTFFKWLSYSLKDIF